MSWRSWGKDCILSNLNAWDGSKPSEPLYQDLHFDGRALEIGGECIADYKKAIGIMKECRREREREVAAGLGGEYMPAVNPAQQSLNKKDCVISHMDEDIRLFDYGRIVMELTVLFIKYYNALYSGTDSDTVWYKIEKLSEEAAGKYMPIKYENSVDNIELMCKDIFERSQLRELYYRCLKQRLN